MPFKFGLKYGLRKDEANAPDAPDAPDASDAPNAADAPGASNVVTPDAPDASNAAEAAEAPDAADAAEAGPESLFGHIRQMFLTDRFALAGALVIAVFIVIAVFAPVFAPFDPYKNDLDNRLAPMDAGHLLGTDAFGRDVLTRIFYGARISLVIGLVPSVTALVIGTALGLVAGYMGKTADFIIMRLADIVLSFPSLLLAIVIMYTLGASLLNLFIALSIIDWGVTARTVRAQTLSLREKEFVEAARALGVKKGRIMFRHILPNCVPSIIVIFTLDIPLAVLAEASLSFLGVGAQPPQASWGLMVFENKPYLFSAPWVALAPGIAIILLVLAFNFVGDGLRDALDPFMQE